MTWYVIHSKPNKEEFLYNQIRIRNMDVYYPSVKVLPVNPRARKRKPYFPGYLFIRADLEALGSSMLKWMPGAIGLVNFGGIPASVPEDFLQKIRRKLAQLNGAYKKRNNEFKANMPVTIQSGPFTGYSAIFDSHLSDHERVCVLLQMIQDRQVVVELPAEQIVHQTQDSRNIK